MNLRLSDNIYVVNNNNNKKNSVVVTLSYWKE